MAAAPPDHSLKVAPRRGPTVIISKYEVKRNLGASDGRRTTDDGRRTIDDRR
ncbi:MAG TPA: hypothetical protein VJ183_17480 [Chloroflexia bacterium]|nr:hypothetical protein [Chloroflexia bacterium]